MWTVSVSCDQASVQINARLFSPGRDPHDYVLESVAGSDRRITSVFVADLDRVSSKTILYSWSAGRLDRVETRSAIVAPGSEYDRTNTIVFDEVGLPESVTRTDAIGETVNVEWIEREGESSPPRITFRRFDFGGDGQIDYIERYLYNEGGDLNEVALERPDGELEFVPVGDCCADVCGDSTPVEIVEPVKR